MPVFFFQAEDGIRDYKVTGVQTCALPICLECRGLQPLQLVEDRHFALAVEPLARGGAVVQHDVAETMAAFGQRHVEQLRAHGVDARSEEHTSELQSPCNLVCRLLLEKKKKK